VVKTWWIAWYTWCFSSRFLGLENYARFWGFIFGYSLFGNEVGWAAILFSLFYRRPLGMGFVREGTGIRTIPAYP
jgi:hypothetical protein